ncbi:hypothetical protein Atai01_54030 [Amycolatopsis taiwanensis]|uniref:Uncharacterized protein n=1 Tax=Amycolatopsis taiwanensis TaxID=342230 RepID=A0A9W6VIT3_9PSEU|nr:hypothetical protein Atai01_54030 [Amycolatopsis taiwanensis]
MIVQIVQSTSWWQVVATIATPVGVLTAIAVALANMVQRRHDNERRAADEEAKSLAQARLVITGQGNPGVRPARPDENPDGEYPFVMDFPFANHGDRPVLDVFPEIWREMSVGNPESAQKFSIRAPLVKSGEETTFSPKFSWDPGAPGYMGWLIRWTDADGKQWYRDTAHQDAPRRYNGQRPENHRSSNADVAETRQRTRGWRARRSSP